MLGAVPATRRAGHFQGTHLAARYIVSHFAPPDPTLAAPVRICRPEASQMFPLVLDLAADGVPVAVTCRTLGFSKQAFYQWKSRPVTDRDWADAHLINAAIDIHHDDPEFGYRFIADELAGQGTIASGNRVNRLCT
ncbi:hypothetical protein GCM10009539_22760 [Cryptosporangium japonicum]|uniref:Transposase n=1 Tax=Cryptosporangium japonicum TaxID=80872 RepID=A0ABN0U2X0_9ACTN